MLHRTAELLFVARPSNYVAIMSGIKQHYIPRLLLRAFRINPKGKVAQVRVYRNERSYVANVDDVAAERFFYSQLSSDGTETLDDAITRYENALATDIAGLVSSATPAVDGEVAARVVTHLLVRNHHVRGFMSTGVAHLAKALEDLFGDDDRISAAMGSGGASAGPRFRELFDQHIEGQSVLAALGLPQPVLLSLSYMLLREARSSGEFEALSNSAREIAGRMRKEGQVLTREAHVRSLSESLAPEKRVNALRTLEWTVTSVPGTTFILPDFVALGIDSEGVAGSLLAVPQDMLGAVLMPLSPNRILVGRRAGYELRLAEFNSLSARHCIDFFVSTANDSQLQELSGQIGEGVETQIAEIMEEVTAKYRDDSAVVAPIGVGEGGAFRRPDSIQLQSDTLVPERGRDLGATLGALVGLVQDRFDISALARIEVPADFEAAMSRLAPEVAADAESAATGEPTLTLAYNVSAEVEGRLAIIMLLRPEIAEALLQREGPEFSQASGIVLAQFARIGTAALLESVFADGLNAGTGADSLLIPHAIPAWQSFFVEGYAALLDPQRQIVAIDALIAALNGLSGRLGPVRRAYRTHGDLHRLLAEALDAVGNALTLAAAAASPVPNLPESVTQKFESELEMAGYGAWFKLFRADLGAIWLEGARYPSQDAFLVLARHVERLLVAGAIFIWDDDGRARVEVPFWSDLEWMATEAAAGAAGNTSDHYSP